MVIDQINYEKNYYKNIAECFLLERQELIHRLKLLEEDRLMINYHQGLISFDRNVPNVTIVSKN